MTSLCESLITSGYKDAFNFAFEEDEQEEIRFEKAAIDEIERYRQLDEWIPSYHNVYSMTALDCKRRLQQEKVIPANATDFMQYTQEGTFALLRLRAFNNLVELGMLKVDLIMQYLLYVLCTDPSPLIRSSLLRLFSKGLGSVAIGEGLTQASEPQQDGLVIVQEGGATDSRRLEIARTQTIPGAVKALREELGANETLKQALWGAVTYVLPILSSYQVIWFTLSYSGPLNLVFLKCVIFLIYVPYYTRPKRPLW
jgi:transcription initiation factor TFIID subunit 2